MPVGEVFSRAFELWKKDALWLILAGAVIGVIIWLVALVAGLTVAGLVAGGLGIGLSGGGDVFSGLGVAAILGAIVIGIVTAFLVAVLGVTLQGGLFEMVLGAAKHGRPIRFADLFSGFRRFGSYVVFALAVAGVLIGCGLLFVTILGIPVAIALAVWIGVLWLYVLPLITDQDLSFGDAQRRSREMVKASGWWRTFGGVALLGVVGFIANLLISAVFGGGGSDPTSAQYIGLQFASMVVSAVWSTYAVCYIAVMYLLASGAEEPVKVGAFVTPPPPPPPAFTPPAPPASRTIGGASTGAPPAPLTPPVAAVPPNPAPPPAPGQTGQAYAAGPGEVGDQGPETTALPFAPPAPPAAPDVSPPVPPQLT